MEDKEKKVLSPETEEKIKTEDIPAADASAKADVSAETALAADASAEVSSEEPEQKPAPKAAETQAAADETGVIAKNTRIVGNIVTNGHLAIYGQVEGNVTARGDIIITGSITGDIACDNIKLSGCSAKTNLNARNGVTIDQNAKLEGKIACGKIAIDGMVRGDIDATEEINIYQNSSVIGDLKSKALAIESGAELQGNVKVTR